jgi:uncharacterized protein involved in exopolysaccharide biosynthesis
MGDTHACLSAVRRGWKTILLAGVIACATATAIALVVPLTYESEARLLVSVSGDSVDVYGTRLAGDATGVGAPVETQAALLRSRTLVADVIDRLKLPDTPEELSRRMEVAPIRSSSVISIKVRDSAPQRAADIANALANVYVANGRAARQRSLKAAADALATRITGVQAELAALGEGGGGVDAQRRAAADRLSGLEQSLERLRVAQQLGEGQAVVTDAAVPATNPTGPTPVTTAAGGLLAGVLLGLALVIGQGRRDARLAAEEPATRAVADLEPPVDLAKVRRRA